MLPDNPSALDDIGLADALDAHAARLEQSLAEIPTFIATEMASALDVQLAELRGELTRRMVFFREAAKRLRGARSAWPAEGEFDIKNERIQGALRTIAGDIRGGLPKGWGFMLMLFSFGEGGANFYASNANRADIIKVMLEWIARERKKH